MSMPSAREILDQTKPLAFEAGKIALKYLNEGFNVYSKGEDGPVTDADRAVNDYLVEAIAKRFPKTTIISEELPGVQNPGTDWEWWIDPIDGTREFVRKTTEWSIMIGLRHKTRSIVGLVYQPGIGMLFSAAQGEGAHQETLSSTDVSLQRLQHSGRNVLKGATLVGSKSHPSRRGALFKSMTGIDQSYTHGSVGLKIAHVCQGRADVYLNFSRHCHGWDLCAAETIAAESAVRICDTQGVELQYTPEDHRIDKPFLSAPFDLVAAVIQSVNDVEKLPET